MKRARNRLRDEDGKFISYSREQAIAVFWSGIQIKESDQCWPWQGTTIKGGYGQLNFQGQQIGAHRLAFLLAGGILLKNQDVCHTCDNPPCCNPKHLFAGTSKENNADCRAKDRHMRGSRNSTAKLSDEVVLAMRADREAGMTYRALAKKYGVAHRTAWEVINGFAWKHLPKES